VIQNAGGLSSLEALASGLPVISYRCLPGHGSTNAAALETAGWAPWARRPDDLPGMLAAALAGPPRTPPVLAEDPAEIVAGLVDRDAPAVLPATREPALVGEAS
jgi:UDP-N-acetylglucosamine:LPS N-acetylglucosamine transferase